MGGDIKPVNTKESKPREVAGQPFPTLPYKGVETYSIPMPMLPVLEDATSPVRRNGLGECMLSLWGANTAGSQLSSSGAYVKTFTWEDLIKTFTLWNHYTEVDRKARMCAMDSLDVNIKADGELTFDFEAKGANLEDCSDYGSETPISLATAKQITGLGARFDWGEPQASARNEWEDLTLSFKRNLDYGAPGKAGQHPAGSASPQCVTSTKSECRLAFTIRDADGKEFDRWRVGGVTAPSADRHTDIIVPVDACLTLYGTEIGAHLWAEPDTNNAGTTTAVIAGSYSGGSTVCMGEVELDPYCFTTAQGSNKDLSFHSLSNSDVTVTCTTGVGTLDVTVASHDITITQAAGGSTAAAIKAKWDTVSAATALCSCTLAAGSTGEGSPDDWTIQAVNVDGFRYRYTTGGGWSAWSDWEMITTNAQTINHSLTLDFSSASTGADGDRFYYGSHAMYNVRFNLPNMIIEKAEQDFSGGIRKLKVEAYHSSAATASRPTMELTDKKSTAYA